MKFWLSSRLSRDWLIEFSWHDGVLETYMVPAFALIHKTPTIVHLKDCVMGGMLMQTDQRARTKVLLFMKPFYLNCQLSCEPGISIVCCFLTGPFQTHNCFKRKLTSAWFFFQLLSQISVFQDNTLILDDCMVLLGISLKSVMPEGGKVWGASSNGWGYSTLRWSE